MAIFEIGLLTLGGALNHQAVPIGTLDFLAIGLLILGSYMNTGSEWQRKIWKQDMANKGHCYTKGLFRYSMHINYFGDTVLFTGWALLTANFWALGLPLMMSLMFVFMHIPGLDAYLSQRYGQEFDEYALRTKRLIPFVY